MDLENAITEAEFKEALNTVYDYFKQQDNEIDKERLKIFSLASDINDGDFLRKVSLLLKYY